jgi:cytochrome c2
MKRVTVLILITMACATTVRAADPSALYLPADPLEGAELFAEKGCEKCHSIEGRGGSFGPDLARSDLNRSLLDIFALMWSHSPQMSGIMVDLRLRRATFTREELAALAAYIYAIAYFDKPGDIAIGMKVFSAKNCSRCHRVGGIGRDIGPDLAPLKRYVSPIFLAQQMWNHGPRIKSRMDELGIEWPEFEGAEVADLMAFLRDASPSTDPTRIFMRPGSPEIGRQHFQDKKCIACHRVFDVGRAIGPDLTQSTFHKTATSIATVMWNHGPAIWEKMTELGLTRAGFEENEMADLTAFLYFLRFSEDPADMARGEMLFEQKGCHRCHHFGETAVEDSYNLSLYEGDVTALEIAARMWNEADAMSEMATRKRVPWPRFAPGEMNDLISYILSQNER